MARDIEGVTDLVVAYDNPLGAGWVKAVEPAERYVTHPDDMVGPDLIRLLNFRVGNSSRHLA